MLRRKICLAHDCASILTFSYKVKLSSRIRPGYCTGQWLHRHVHHQTQPHHHHQYFFHHEMHATKQLCRRRDSIAVITARLRDGSPRNRVRFAVGLNDSSPLRSFKTDSTAQLSSYSVGTGDLSSRERRPRHEADHLYLVPRLGMSETILVLPSPITA